MDVYIVIPAHNEEENISKTLQSLADQTLVPKKIMVVNDHSTDATQQLINSFSSQYSFIDSIEIQSKAVHEPGSKVIQAFNKGLEKLDDKYDVICKFDADLIFPENYLESICKIFRNNPACGMAGGFCYIEKNGDWVLENLTNKDHIRGALKAYRKECFTAIRGLKNEMGWDTVDELSAQYNGWQICTDPSLHVRHLKPTGKIYTKASKYKQGEAFYRLRYGFLLTLIATLKLSVRKSSCRYFIDSMKGYFRAKNTKTPFMVSEEEGAFIRKLRWKNIKQKIG
ncbi:glycosyltransferase family 2 protein [Jejudonia soesokkakensis]|uniref:Glycosyltransferase family 2 protein n=1 Tax=Jejudonia soesokkakensis TaxID=1323432 RepID=A0ABW2MV15_9FLAO